MTPFPVKPRQCEMCPKQFVPRNSMQKVCGPVCAHKKVKAQKVDERAQIKTRKEAAKTRGTLIKEAQFWFNKFIRLRDAGLPCICCGKPFEPMKPGGSVDAGHYLSRGSAPHLKFNENNCFAQRKNCNRPGGTTRSAFRNGVMERIGVEALEELEADQSSPRWRDDDFRAIRDLYKQKCKALEKERA